MDAKPHHRPDSRLFPAKNCTMMYNHGHSGAFMARKKTGSRYRLLEPLDSELTALCAALPGKPSEIGVIRDAVRAYIKTLISGDSELRQRYENALKIQRGGSEGDNVVALPKRSD